MIRSCLLALGLACLASPGQAQDARQADANDCAVFGAVLAGKPFEMFSNAFGATCDWKAMGITVKIVPPPEGKYYDGVKTSLSPPRYTDDGKASFDQSVGGQSSAASYFYAGYTCTAEKRGGQWHSTGCRMKYIT
ncbi:MAG: hypothetical protein JWP16_2412 [Alphaproteobacteria bacterium]|nr:hypothetical protein [Alphaproteobacteria bacterium]